MAYILTTDWLVKGSMQNEVGRGGYFPSSSATSEGQALLIKGSVAAYRATNQSQFLDRARNYANALIKYFFFDTPEPPVSGAWPCQWIVNAGTSFQIKGPISPYGSMYSGNLNVPISFVNGEATIANLGNVYKVASSDSILRWNNVFSNLSVGTDYAIANWYDVIGTQYDNTGTATKVTDIAKAGLIKLGGAQATFTGTANVTYAVFINTTIPYGANFECWPMWRTLEVGEWKCAADSLHWMYDAFSMLFQYDATQSTRWLAAKNAIKRNWDNCLQLTSDTFWYKKESGKPFDSWPLVFYKIMVGTTMHTHPTPYWTVAPSRDVSGNAVFSLPLDTARTDFIVANESIYINGVWTTDADRLSVQIGVSTPTPIEFIIRDTADNAYHMRWNLIDNSTLTNPILIPLSWFNASYSWNNGSSPCWVTGGIMQYHMDIPTPSDGVGFGGNWVNAPSITYNLTSGSMGIRVTDSLGVQSTVALTTGAHTIALAKPGTANIVNIDFIPYSNGTNQVTVDTFTGIVNNTSPLHIRKMEIHVRNTAAVTVSIGDVKFEGAAVREPINFNGQALPFQYSSDNPNAVTTSTAANFQGPYYIGYQNPCPYIDSAEWTKAEGMIDLMVGAQAAYTLSTGDTGPYAPVYFPMTWDSVMFGTANTYGWTGPDPNTFWGGFQYRAFMSLSDFWSRCSAAGISNNAVTKAAASCNSFLGWLDTWLTDHPGDVCVPTAFNIGTLATVPYSDPHMIANALKGAIYCYKAGANQTIAKRTIDKLYTLLVAFNVTTGDMKGSFTPDPVGGYFNGYWAGEILEALSMHLETFG